MSAIGDKSNHSFMFIFVFERHFLVFIHVFTFFIQNKQFFFQNQSPPESFLFEKDPYQEYGGLLNISEDSTMETIMNELFKKLKIDNPVWQLSKNMKYHQITFFVESNARHELVLSTLNEWGVGQRNGSCMSMIPCAIYNQSSKVSDLDPRTE